MLEKLNEETKQIINKYNISYMKTILRMERKSFNYIIKNLKNQRFDIYTKQSSPSYIKKKFHLQKLIRTNLLETIYEQKRNPN